MNKSTIYIPVEIAQRELEYKRRLARLFEEQGFNVELKYLDDMFDDILSGKSPSGVVFVKSIQRYLFLKLFILKLLGNKIVYMEEEAWVPFNERDIVRRRFPIRNRLLIDLIFCPNRFLFNAFKDKLFVSEKKIHLVGSDRMIPKESAVFKSNKEVLVLGSIVATQWSKYWKIFRKELGWKSSLYKKKYFNYFQKSLRDNEKLLELANSLSNKGYSVSYRPHPAELSKQVINSKIKIVSNSMPVAEQAGNYDIILHPGSTSAFELSNGNLVAVSDEATLDIHSNSKFYGPIATKNSDLNRIINGEFNCIFNNDYLVNPSNFRQIFQLLKHEQNDSNNYKLLVQRIFLIYKKNLMRYRRNNDLVTKKKDAWN